MKLSDRYTEGTLIRGKVLEAEHNTIVKPSTGAMTYSVKGSGDNVWRVQVLATPTDGLATVSCNCPNGVARAEAGPSCYHSVAVLIRLGFK